MNDSRTSKAHRKSNKHTLLWLLGSDFHATTLCKIVRDNQLSFPQNETERSKVSYSKLICDSLDNAKLSPNTVIEYYAREPRAWLSFRLGSHSDIFHELNDPTDLLFELGTPGWYGPIIDSKNEQRAWYFRTFNVQHNELTASGELRQILRRWVVIAEVTASYVALSWRGFSQPTKVMKTVGVKSTLQMTQYPFWNEIPMVYQELQEHLDGNWEVQNLFNIILNKFWERYREHPKYEWMDLRVRADKFGVIVNAHSSRVKEISGKGLRSFSSKLAQVAVKAIPISGMSESEAFKKAENAIIRTLVKDWGTKSYEFSLDERNPVPERRRRRNPSSLSQDDTELKPVFLAHCFFGEDMKSGTQDGLQHLHCAMSHGGSEATLQFLLRELLLNED